MITKLEKNFFSNRVQIGFNGEEPIILMNLLFDNGTILTDFSKLHIYLSFYSNDRRNLSYNNGSLAHKETIYKFNSCNEKRYFPNNKYVLIDDQVGEYKEGETFSCFSLSKADLIYGEPIDDFFIEGDSLRPFYRELNILVSVCPFNKNTSDFECSSQDYLSQEDLNKASLIYLFPNYEMHFENYEKPLKRFFEIKSVRLSSQTTKQINIRLTRGSLSTDSGLIRESLINNEFYNVEDVSYTDNRKQGSFIALVKFSSSMKENIFKRKYDKIQDVMAKVGGMMKILVFLIIAILGPFQRVKNFFFLLNKMEKEIIILNGKGMSKLKKDKEKNQLKASLCSVLIISYLPEKLISYFHSAKSLQQILNKHKMTTDLRFLFKKLTKLELVTNTRSCAKTVNLEIDNFTENSNDCGILLSSKLIGSEEKVDNPRSFNVKLAEKGEFSDETKNL